MSLTLLEKQLINSDKQFITEFIEVYRNNPALWKYDSYVSKDVNLRKIGKYNLLLKCKQTYPEADREFVRKKINNLRSALRREFLKVQNSRPTPSSPPLYKPTLWYYDLLKFIIEDCTVNIRYNTIIYDGQRGNNLQNKRVKKKSTKKSLTQNREKQKRKKKNRENSQLQRQQEQLEITTNSISTDALTPTPTPISEKERTTQTDQQSQNIPDEFEAIAINVAAKLRKMAPTQQILAEGLIQTILQKGIFEELTRFTCLTEENTLANNSDNLPTTSVAYFDPPVSYSPCSSVESSTVACKQEFIVTNIESLN